MNLADVMTDLDIMFNNIGSGNPTQFEEAFDLFTNTISSVPSNTAYSFTGHSLGGGIAQYMTHQTETLPAYQAGKSVTFNAVGIGQVLGSSNIDPRDYDDLITDYVNQNDLIGEYGLQLGKTIYLLDDSYYANSIAFRATSEHIFLAQGTQLNYFNALSLGYIQKTPGTQRPSQRR